MQLQISLKLLCGRSQPKDTTVDMSQPVNGNWSVTDHTVCMTTSKQITHRKTDTASDCCTTLDALQTGKQIALDRGQTDHINLTLH